MKGLIFVLIWLIQIEFFAGFRYQWLSKPVGTYHGINTRSVLSMTKNLRERSGILQNKSKARKTAEMPRQAAEKVEPVKSEADWITEDLLNEWEQEEISLQQKAEKERIQREWKEEQKEMQKNPPKISRFVQKVLDELVEEEEEGVEVAKLPVVVVVGRPNTGKSTFVNKVSDSALDGTIVFDEPGITRDRTYQLAMWDGYHFQIVDTGGLVFDDTMDQFAEKVKHQTILALKDAVAVIMVCDGKEGLTPHDYTVADWLRKKVKLPHYLAVSKCESFKYGELQAQEFWKLGLGQPYPVSGIHGTGVDVLLDDITSKHMVKIKKVIPDNSTNIAIVGRPNVGKSSLVNRLCGEERSIVSNVAGTTRDTIDVVIARGNQTFRLIDTAGIRRKSKVYYGPEFFMVNRAFKAIRRADVAVLVVDCIEGIVDQDRILAQRIVDEGRACVIVANKWDAVEDKDSNSYSDTEKHIRSVLPDLKFAEILMVSAKLGVRTEKIIDAIKRSAVQFHRRISTAILNEIVSEAVLWMTPPTIKSKQGRIYYAIQVSTAPPTLVFFVNDPSLFTDNYKRYLERKIRESLNFQGTPLRIFLRGKSARKIAYDARKGELKTTIKDALKAQEMKEEKELQSR